MLTPVVIMLLLLVVFGALPAWDHSRTWGFVPASGAGLVLVIVVIFWLMGYLR